MTRPGATSVPRSGRAVAAVGLAAALALAAAPASAALPGAIVVLPASGHGVSAPYVQHARWLLIQALSTKVGAFVVDFDRPPIAEKLEPWRLAAYAASLGGSVALAVDVSREAGVTTVDVACFDAVTAKLVCRAREATTAGPDTLAATTGALTARLSESLGARRQAPSRGWPGPHGVRFGARALVAVPRASPGGGALGMGGFGLVVSVNLTGAFVDLGGDVVAGAGRFMGGGGLGVFALLGSSAPARRAPYFGGSVHWIGQDLGGRRASGAQLRPAVGYAWGRDQIAQTRLELAYFVNLFREQKMDRLIPGSDATYLSHGPMLSLGAAF